MTNVRPLKAPLPPPTPEELGLPAHDPQDPDPGLALFLDQGLPMDPHTKAAVVRDLGSRSRRFLYPLLWPVGRLLLVLAGLVRLVLPERLASSRLLHRLIYGGLKHFVSPEANLLILRHFHVGSELVAFIAANAPVPLEPRGLRPRGLEDVLDDLFLVHDYNLFNFVIRLNLALKERGETLRPPERLDFSMISEEPFPIALPAPRGTTVLDMSTARELPTPLYQLFLSRRDFERANQSLQLDETMAIYVARLLGDASHLGLVNNRHPLVPHHPLRAGHRLQLHGLGAELLHAVLVQHKRRQREQEARGERPAAQGLGALWGLRSPWA
jgi:hypothetical protein